MTTTACKDLPTQEELHRLFDYNPETGELTWRVTRSSNAVAGARAGALNTIGYRVVHCLGKRHLEHRVIWCLIHGCWPELPIDHINAVRSDNRQTNLRLATKSENAINSGLFKHNTSGARGVYWRPQKRKWQAMIQVQGRQVHLGFFRSIAEAAAARLLGEQAIFSSFAQERTSA